MIITSDFVLVHVPKTGGTFLRELIRETCESVEIGGPARHSTIAELPPEHLDKPRIGFIRDPWDWYVSWFEHQRIWGADLPPYWEFEIEKGDFRHTLRLAFANSTDFYSQLAQQYLEGVPEVGRTENLREDFCAFLDRHDIAATGLREAVMTREPIGAGQNPPTSSYYDDETCALIADSYVARHYGYAPPRLRRDPGLD